MVRKALERLEGERLRFTAKVDRFGSKPPYKGYHDIPTILLTQVARLDNAEYVTDHLWWTRGKWAKGLQEGDRIAFDARVSRYVKGYFGRRDDVYKPPEVDYRLERPTKVETL